MLHRSVALPVPRWVDLWTSRLNDLLSCSTGRRPLNANAIRLPTITEALELLNVYHESEFINHSDCCFFNILLIGCRRDVFRHHRT